MAPMALEGSGGGNTRLPRLPASKTWTFTLFYEHLISISEFKELIGSDGYYIFGVEKCPTTGKKHLQGYIVFHKKCRPLEKIKMKEIHWEKAKGNKEQNTRYCTKDGEWHSNNEDFFFANLVIDPLEGKTLYPWQQEVIQIIKSKPNDRTIFWYWEEFGNMGKTALAKHCYLNYGTIFLSGKGPDIKYAISQLKERPKSVIFGFPRTMEEGISYQALEEVKDGLFFSGKYEGGMLCMNPPHVIVFANFPPQEEKLSSDRWKIINIRGDTDNHIYL